MAPEVISPQVNDYGVELGYDPAKVRGLRGDDDDGDVGNDTTTDDDWWAR